MQLASSDRNISLRNTTEKITMDLREIEFKDINWTELVLEK
jgi:hypothetical protein